MSSTKADSSSDMLQPNQDIKPHMTENVAKELVEDLYGLKVLSVKELNSYDDKNYLVKVDKDHTNPHIKEVWPHGYTLKVLNSMDSKKSHIEAEHLAIKQLRENNFSCCEPVLNLMNQDKSHEKIFYDENENINESTVGSEGKAHSVHICRLLTFLPGKIFFEIPYTPEIIYEAGQTVGRLDKALQGFSHPALTSHATVWSLSSVPKLTDFVFAVQDKEDKALVEDVISAFSEEVLTNVDKFRKGVIHGDFNEQNIIVQEKNTDGKEKSKDYTISGVIDFGDMQESYYVFEVAITIMYMMVESKVIDPMLAGGHVLAGYKTAMELNDIEFDVLKTCVAGRYCQSLVMGAYTHSQDPTNDYVLVTAKNGWPQLRRLWGMPKAELYEKWREIMDSYEDKK